MNLPKIVLRTIGVASILMAVLGLYHNGVSLFNDYSDIRLNHAVPYFYPAFYTMSVICFSCFLLLFAFGIQFWHLNTRVVWPFTLLLAFEFIYFFAVGIMWLDPDWGYSIAAATGVANGGLTFQLVTLFPIWAIPATFWAKYQIGNVDSSRKPVAQ